MLFFAVFLWRKFSMNEFMIEKCGFPMKCSLCAVLLAKSHSKCNHKTTNITVMPGSFFIVIFFTDIFYLVPICWVCFKFRIRPFTPSKSSNWRPRFGMSIILYTFCFEMKTITVRIKNQKRCPKKTLWVSVPWLKWP